VKQASKITLQDFEENDIVISSSPLYSSMSDEFQQTARLTDKLYRRLGWKNIIYMIVREAANLYFSRLKVSDSQTQAKAEMIYEIREARHCGLSLGLDTLRYQAVDIDVRNLADYLFFKAQGVMGFSKDLIWLYSFFDPIVVRNCAVNRFFLLTRTGAIGYGNFGYPSWHKTERENILDILGISVEYGEELNYGVDKGRFQTIGDKEHARIITLHEEGLGMIKIAQKLGRSSASVEHHIRQHKEVVEREGFCRRCRRVSEIII
jgi:hypothetical protein